MSSTGLDFSCIDKLQDELKKMGKKADKIERKAIEKGAEPILNEMINNCPYRSGKAQKYLKISKPQKQKGRIIVKIGVNKEDNSEAYYLKFYEYGTSAHTYKASGIFKGATIRHPGQVARPFMRPAFENKKNEALEITAKIIKEELNK